MNIYVKRTIGLRSLLLALQHILQKLEINRIEYTKVGTAYQQRRLP